MEQTAIILCLVLSLVFIILGFLFWKKIVSSIKYPAKILACVLSSAIFLFLVTYTIANFVTGSELNYAMISAKKAGLLLTLKEMVPPPVPDNENAAILYEECFSIYERLKERYSKEWKDMSLEKKVDIKGLSLAQKERLIGIFDNPDFVRMYELLRKAVDMPSCRFNLRYEDGYKMGLPHLDKMRKIAIMIAINTVLLTEQSRYEEALEFSKLGLHLSLSLRDEPIYVSQLFRMFYDYFAMKGLMETLSNIPPDAVTIDIYQRLIGEIDLKKDNIGLRKALEGNTAAHVDIFEKIIHGEVRLNEIFGDTHLDKDSLLKKIYWRFYTSYLGRPLIKKDSAFYINSMLKILSISFSPYYEIKDKIVEFEKEFGETSLRISSMRWRHPLSSEFLPWLIREQKRWTENTAKLNGLRIALALKIYKAEKNEYPNFLDTLIPEYLPELPKDPFTGKDYIYRKEDDGFIVYSVGKNGKDDSGIFGEKSPGFPDDLAWRSSK
ncbi:MAG: hypothetical protein HY606_04125 [Planctomycetes bacterium]|nr:hypothetical protein [Planctomycetota bacterium]